MAIQFSELNLAESYLPRRKWAKAASIFNTLFSAVLIYQSLLLDKPWFLISDFFMKLLGIITKISRLSKVRYLWLVARWRVEQQTKTQNVNTIYRLTLDFLNILDGPLLSLICWGHFIITLNTFISDCSFNLNFLTVNLGRLFDVASLEDNRIYVSLMWIPASEIQWNAISCSTAPPDRTDVWTKRRCLCSPGGAEPARGGEKEGDWWIWGLWSCVAFTLSTLSVPDSAALLSASRWAWTGSE